MMEGQILPNIMYIEEQLKGVLNRILGVPLLIIIMTVARFVKFIGVVCLFYVKSGGK